MATERECVRRRSAVAVLWRAAMAEAAATARENSQADCVLMRK